MISFALPKETTPVPCPIAMGSAASCGHVFSASDRCLTLDGAPFSVIMAEMHFSRYDCRLWEEELRKIRASGVNTVSFYLFWIHHEEQEGVFRFDVDRDVRRFVLLCKKLGLYVWMRPGPWCHGEARNGGFPDWLIRKCPHLRCNDDTYLFYVDRLYAAYAEQLDGLYYKDGGPIIGLQVENELTNDPGHLAKLKALARSHGMDVPFYSVTAWAGSGVADFPAHEVLPMFGSYPEAPWDNDSDPLEGSPCVLPVPGRSDGTIGSDQILSNTRSVTEDVLAPYPYLTCETGPGVQMTHHRRPIIAPMDVYTMAMMTVFKGCTGIGYYVYHGGRNPVGGLYQESKDTGYPNDVPVSSYDFQAPLSEYGVPRPSYDYFRLLHALIDSEKDVFPYAQTVYSPDAMSSRMDTDTPRVLFRGLPTGEGCLLVDTYQRLQPLDPLSAFQVGIGNGDTAIRIPRDPVDLPSGLCAAFPVHFSIGGVSFDYALAQPITTLVRGDREIRFFAAQNGVPCEFSYHGSVCPGKNAVLADRGLIRVLPGRTPAFTVGNTVVIVLSFADALRFYRFGDRVYLSGRAMYEKDGVIVEYGDFSALRPKETCFFDPDALTFRDCSVSFDEPCPVIRLEKEGRCTLSPENIYAHYLFSPTDACVSYRLTVTPDAFRDADELLLHLAVHGDVGQLYAGDELLADFCAAGTETVVGLSRFRDAFEQGIPVTLVLSPLGNKRLYLERFVSRTRTEAKAVGVTVIRHRVIPDEGRLCPS